MTIKKVNFASQPHLIFVFESGADEFAFDNQWPDGSRKLSFHMETSYRPRRSSRRERWRPFEGEEVLAHARALDLMRGRQLRLPEAGSYAMMVGARSSQRRRIGATTQMTLPTNFMSLPKASSTKQPCRATPRRSRLYGARTTST